MQYCTHITSYHEKYSIYEIYRQSDKGDASLKSGRNRTFILNKAKVHGKCTKI